MIALRARARVNRLSAAADRKRAASDRAAARSEREYANAELLRAQIDELTGVYGRRLGLAMLEHEIDRTRRGTGRLVLAFVDVDQLKTVNDRHGHAAGDALLRNVASALRAHLRSYDHIVRLGGDEFVCGLVDSSVADARRRFSEIRSAIQAVHAEGASISVGFAELLPTDTLNQLVMRGDSDLYRARQKQLA